MHARWLVGWLVLAVFTALAAPATAEEPKLRRETVVLKHADGRALEQMIRPYLTKNGMVRYVDETRALTISDEHGAVEVVLKLIQKFDLKPAQLQIAIKLVLADKVDKPVPPPPELAGVARQLADVFAFNRFEVKDTAMLVTEVNRDASLTVAGESGFKVDLSTNRIEGEAGAIRLKYHLYRQRQVQSPQGTIFVKDSLVATTVEMKDGETAILGASKIDGDNKALVSVVTLKVKK